MLARLILAPVTRLPFRTTRGKFIAYRFIIPLWVVLTPCRHYIENTSKTEDLVWIEIYKSDRVADISLTQWLALTPADIVAQTLKVPLSFVNQLKKEKQVLLQ